MEKMIRRLYTDMLKQRNCRDRISQKTRDEIESILKNMEMECQGCMDYRDMVFLAASAAEENGFVEGFKYAFRLFTECIRE